MIADLKEFYDHLCSGKRISDKYTVRTVYKNFNPREYTPEMVREIRDSLYASQAVFAKVLAVSARTVQAWERGDSTPSPVCRRLLDIVHANPNVWIDMLSNTVRVAPANKSA